MEELLVGEQIGLTSEEKKAVIARIGSAAAIAFELIQNGELELHNEQLDRDGYDQDAYLSVFDYGASQGLLRTELALVAKYSADIAESAKLEFEQKLTTTGE